LFCLQARRSIFLGFLIGEMTAGDAAAYSAKHCMAVTDKVAPDSAYRSAFQTTCGVCLCWHSCRQDKCGEHPCLHFHISFPGEYVHCWQRGDSAALYFARCERSRYCNVRPFDQRFMGLSNDNDEKALMKNRDQQLRLFLEIAQCGSLSRAADALDLTQSGLSKQLSSLETFLGQRLFERHGRGVALTDAGRKLDDVARPAYALVDKAILQLQEHQGVTEGTLRVATIHTLSYHFFGEVMATFMSQRPKVNVTMLGRSSPEVVELVESGKADIGFVYDTAVASDAVEITQLFRENMCLVVHEQSPLAMQPDIDLREHPLPLIVFPPHYAIRRMLHANGLDANVAAEVETVDAMLKLASVTLGQCVLPDRIPTKLLQEYHLTRIKIVGPALERSIVAITRRDRVKTALSVLMLEIACKTIL